MKVDEVYDLSEEDFRINYLDSEKPVLFKNYVASWEASNWTLEIMKKKAGHNTVFVRRNTNEKNYRTGKKYNIESMKFSEYISNIENNKKKAYSSYLAVQNIRRALPELQHDIHIPKYVKKLHGGPFLWIAIKGHYEFCHFDPDDNVLIVFSGEKLVKLYPAKYLKNLYPNPLGSNGKTIQSCVDHDQDSLQNYPEFADVECYECTLKSGDMLFFPAFWWHQVTSTETTISMNIFFGNDGQNTYITKIMNNPNQFETFRYWLLNIIEQNRKHKQFSNVLENLDDSLRNFLYKQWKEEATDQQINKLVDVILNYLNLDKLPEKVKIFKHPPPLKIRGLLWR